MARNKYPEETVQIILDAAMQLFQEKGYEKTTVLDIVDRMGGLTRGAFYHHFKSKEEVLDALGDRLFSEANSFEKAKQQKNLTGLEKLKYVLKVLMRSEGNRKIGAIAVQALRSPTFIKKHIDGNQFILSPMFQELIEEGMKDGSIPVRPAKPIADMITILTNFWMITPIFPASLEEIEDRFFFIKYLLERIDVPILDEEIVGIVMEQISQEEE